MAFFRLFLFAISLSNHFIKYLTIKELAMMLFKNAVTSEIKQEHFFNIIAGLSVLSWSVLGILATGESDNLSTVRISIATLHLVIGGLFLLRSPIKRSCGGWGIITALPSLLVGGFAFKMAPLPHEWPLFAELVFILGTCLVVVSILYLGKSFAVFPALREVMVRGPYNIVRHPTYAGEIVMVLGCFLAKPTFLTLGPLLAVLPSIIVRIRSEENMLTREPGYQTYTQKVVWRLLPGIW